MKNKTFSASCPICGRILLKGAPDSYMEISCPKCREFLTVSFLSNGYQIEAGIKRETENIKKTE